MAKIHLNDETLPAFKARIEKLTHESERQFGTMNVLAMMRHIRCLTAMSLVLVIAGCVTGLAGSFSGLAGTYVGDAPLMEGRTESSRSPATLSMSLARPSSWKALP